MIRTMQKHIRAETSTKKQVTIRRKKVHPHMFGTNASTSVLNVHGQRVFLYCYNSQVVPQQTSYPRSAMGKVQPFCRSGLEDNSLQPCCGLLSENFIHHLLKSPSCKHEITMKLLGNNDRFSPCKYCNFFRLSIKSRILVHALPTKFSLGSELSELNQLILFPKNSNLPYLKPFLVDNNNIS